MLSDLMYEVGLLHIVSKHLKIFLFNSTTSFKTARVLEDSKIGDVIKACGFKT